MRIRLGPPASTPGLTSSSEAPQDRTSSDSTSAEAPLGMVPASVPSGSAQTTAAQHAGGATAAQRALGMLGLGRVLKPAVAAAVLGAQLLVAAPAQGAPVDSACADTLKEVVVTQAALRPSEAEIQAQVAGFRARVDTLAEQLRAKGQDGAAQHLVACMNAYAPPGAGDAPLPTLIRALNGDPAAEGALADSLQKYGVTAQPSGKGWKLAAYLRTGNDNMASFDGRYRSDDGATAGLGAGVVLRRGNEAYAVDADYQLYTQRGGMLRTDLVTGLLSYTRESEQGGLQLHYGYDLGVQATGDLGGAEVQDGWHGLNEGNIMAGRRLGQGLQDTYATDPQASALVGVHAGVLKDLGLLQLKAGADVRVPIGPTGLGWVGADAGLGLGKDKGFQVDADLTLRGQWTQGDALKFDGAPLDDATVLIPHVGVGWQGSGWRVGIDWYRNYQGTMPGVGNLDSDNVLVTFTLGGGVRH